MRDLNDEKPKRERAGRRCDREKFASGMTSDRFLRRNIFRALDSFRGQLEGPGENERDWKPENQEEDNDAHGPVWNFEERKDLGGNLNEKPGDDRVSGGNPVDIAPLQLREKVG